MAVKKQLTVCLENKPGQLAKIAAALRKVKVNILAISVSENVDTGLVRIIPSDITKAKKTLSKLGLAVSIRNIVSVPLPDKPGALAEAASKLAKKKINIDYVYGSVHTGCAKAICILGVSNAIKANKILES